MLEDSYDQITHPQKRLEIKTILEAVMGRVIELRDILVSLAGSEYLNLDDILQELKLTPDALEVPVPRYMVEERAKELEEREKLLTALLSQYVIQDGAPMKRDTSVSGPSLSLEEAIRIIQINERGRQGRARAREAKELRNQEKFLHFQPPKMDEETAATCIQRTLRGYLTRKHTKKMREEELEFVGMKPSVRSKEHDPLDKAAATRARRKLIQNQNELEYKQALIQIKKNLIEQEGPDIKERQQDEIRHYFLSHKEQTGKFPVFPREVLTNTKTQNNTNKRRKNKQSLQTSNANTNINIQTDRRWIQKVSSSCFRGHQSWRQGAR
jgi:IQ and AAA domain-containing protein